MGRGGATQQRVRTALVRVGGYWRPLAGVARLLEELGELVESLASPAREVEEIAGELADLWIITTALADQFLGDVVEPGTLSAEPASLHDPIGELLAAAGPIARILNYYDGPKTPRSVAGWPSLEQAVAEFHRTLTHLARAQGVDLGTAVSRKLDEIPIRDSGRFEHDGQDPSTAACLDRFRLIARVSPDFDPSRARLWGSPEWSERGGGSEWGGGLHLQAIAVALGSFARAAVRERLDAYVIAGPSCSSTAQLEEWLGELLGALEDRVRERPREDVVGGVGALLEFNRVAMGVMVFSPLYRSGDPRHSPSDTFAVLRRQGA